MAGDIHRYRVTPKQAINLLDVAGRTLKGGILDQQARSDVFTAEKGGYVIYADLEDGSPNAYLHGTHGSCPGWNTHIACLYSKHTKAYLMANKIAEYTQP